MNPIDQKLGANFPMNYNGDMAVLAISVIVATPNLRVFVKQVKVRSYFAVVALHCRTAPSCKEIVMLLRCGVA